MTETSRPGEMPATFPWWSHPLTMAYKWGIPRLYGWQERLLWEAAKPGSAVVASMNNEAGKTQVIVPAFGLSVMAAFPGATVISTAGVEAQIKHQLFKYLEAKLRPYPSWRVKRDQLTVMGPLVDGLQSRWIGMNPLDPTTFEGYHPMWDLGLSGRRRYCPVCVIVDEAKSVREQMFEEFWRINPDWLLVVSTPGEPVGRFYEAIEVDPEEGVWTYKAQIEREDCPHLQTPEAQRREKALVEKYGEESSFIQSMFRGRFYRSKENNPLLLQPDLDRARGAMSRRWDQRASGRPRRAGLELSSGGDEQVLYIVDGLAVVREMITRESDTVGLAVRHVAELVKFGVPPSCCYADAGGAGVEIIKEMEALGYRPIHRYMNNHIPRNAKDYKDRITEDSYAFKELLKRPDIVLPKDSILFQQMTDRRTVFGAHNVVSLELKKHHRKRTGCSPDRFDALVMAFADWKGPPPAKPPDPYVSALEEEAKRRMGGHRAFSGLRTVPQPRFVNRRPGGMGR